MSSHIWVKESEIVVTTVMVCLVGCCPCIASLPVTFASCSRTSDIPPVRRFLLQTVLQFRISFDPLVDSFDLIPTLTLDNSFFAMLIFVNSEAQYFGRLANSTWGGSRGRLMLGKDYFCLHQCGCTNLTIYLLRAFSSFQFTRAFW